MKSWCGVLLAPLYSLTACFPSPALTDNISKHNVTGFSISSLELIVSSYCLLQSDIRHHPAPSLGHPWLSHNYHQAALSGYFRQLGISYFSTLYQYFGLGRGKYGRKSFWGKFESHLKILQACQAFYFVNKIFLFRDICPLRAVYILYIH